MTAKEYLESKGLNDHDYMDSGMINHISEMMEEYHQAKQLLIQRVSQRSEPLIDIHSYHGDLNGSCLTCGLPEGCHEL